MINFLSFVVQMKALLHGNVYFLIIFKISTTIKTILRNHPTALVIPHFVLISGHTRRLTVQRTYNGEQKSICLVSFMRFMDRKKETVKFQGKKMFL